MAINISIEPTYVHGGVRLNNSSHQFIGCPTCGGRGHSLSSIHYDGIVLCNLSCSHGHKWSLRIEIGVGGGLLIGASVRLEPTPESLALCAKYDYIPANRFVNAGGYSLASERQIEKIRTLGGSQPAAFHELYNMICDYWGYSGFVGWSSNDAGFVISWLLGDRGAPPD